MILKSIQLQGYRSFADLTTLEFSEGVICLVGPEGCGKANLLRGLQAPFCSEDSGDAMLFRGTETRARAEVATVEISWLDGDQACSLKSSYFGNGFGQIDVSPTGYDFKKFTNLITVVSSIAELEAILEDKCQRILLIEAFPCENVRLLTELLREASAHHQMIMVSDYKAVMAISDAIVGVMMEEYGVTSLIAFKLH